MNILLYLIQLLECKPYFCFIFIEWSLFWFIFLEWSLFLFILLEWSLFWFIFLEWSLFYSSFLMKSLDIIHPWPWMFRPRPSHPCSRRRQRYRWLRNLHERSLQTGCLKNKGHDRATTKISNGSNEVKNFFKNLMFTFIQEYLSVFVISCHFYI